MNAITAVFVAACAISFALAVWLARRHVAHVLANRARVPAEFADVIALSAHQRAADYTVAPAFIEKRKPSFKNR